VRVGHLCGFAGTHGAHCIPVAALDPASCGRAGKVSRRTNRFLPIAGYQHETVDFPVRHRASVRRVLTQRARWRQFLIEMFNQVEIAVELFEKLEIEPQLSKKIDLQQTAHLVRGVDGEI